MRHLNHGRKLGRTTPHRISMLRNMAASLFLTEREPTEFDENKPKVKGRITTTLEKAKELRVVVEKAITVAKRAIPHYEEAAKFAPVSHSPGSDEWNDWTASKAGKEWRKSEQGQKWANAISPIVAARRRCIQMLGDKQAVRILFDEIAPRFADREGGYTRVLRLAKVRQGDGGSQAIVEFVGRHDRVKAKAEKPVFASDEKK